MSYLCRSPCELIPRYCTPITEMPEALLAVDQQIETGMDQIRHICRRDKQFSRPNLFVLLETNKISRENISGIQRPKKALVQMIQGSGHRVRPHLLEYGFAPSVHVQRHAHMTFELGRRSQPVEDEMY